jgi:site-specific recombinase XerD
MKCEYIFSSYRRKQLGAKEVRDIMDKAKRKAKLDIEGKQFSPHCLRNFLATYLVNKEVNPILIRTLLHWSQDKNDMLSRYATKDIKKYDKQIIDITDIL